MRRSAMVLAIAVTVMHVNVTSGNAALLRSVFVTAEMASWGVMGEFDTATQSVFIDPSIAEWVAYNNFPEVSNVHPNYPGQAFLGPVALGQDDFIRMTITNPLGEGQTLDISQNDGGGTSFGPQNVFFGDADKAPDVLRHNNAGQGKVFDEGGAFQSLFTSAGEYTFDFSFRNVYGPLGSHSDIWILVNEIPVIPEPTAVLLDIKPGSFPNSVNLTSKGVLPVAILSTDDFDALSLDVDSLLFGDPLLIEEGWLPVAPIRSSEEDVTGDGLMDLTLKFSIPAMLENNVLDSSTETGLLTGMTLGGLDIVGSDAIRIVPHVMSVPEPSAFLLLLVGFVGVAWLRS